MRRTRNNPKLGQPFGHHKSPDEENHLLYCTTNWAVYYGWLKHVEANLPCLGEDMVSRRNGLQ